MTPPLAVVTGASSGIGLEFARQLAASGHDLVVVARDEGRLKELAAELPTLVDVLRADLTDADDLGAVEARLADTTRPVDVLVNNAGFGTMGPFLELPVDGEDREIRLNVLALMRLTRAALPGMVDRHRGGIINVSSVASMQPGPYNATYSATKAFVTSFTEAVHEEVRGSSVNVMALCPGFTRTEFQERAGAPASGVPGLLWQDADAVVREALAALPRGVCRCVPGLPNKAAAALIPLLPRLLVRRMSGMVGRRLRD